MDCIDRFVPKIVIKPYAYPRWFTANLRHKMNCLRCLKRRNTRSPTLHIKERIETVELEIAEESLAACSTYESRLIQDFATSNQSKIYKHIRNLTKADQ